VTKNRDKQASLTRIQQLVTLIKLSYLKIILD